MERFTITTRDPVVREEWGGPTIVAEGDFHTLRITRAPNPDLIGVEIGGIQPDGEPIEDQLIRGYLADVEIMPLD
jgi:hypothetical protein